MAEEPKATGNSVSNDQKPSQPAWLSVIIAVIGGIVSIVVAYITAGKQFDTKLASLQTEIQNAQVKSQDVAKQLDTLSKQIDDAIKKSDLVTLTELNNKLRGYALADHSHGIQSSAGVIRPGDSIHLKFPNTNYYIGARAGSGDVNTAIPGYPPRTVPKGDETFIIEKKRE